MNAAVSPFSLPLGTIRQEERLRLRDRTSIFCTDDVNQCLHNKSGSHEVPNVNFFDFMLLLVDYGNSKFCVLLRCFFFFKANLC